MSNRLAAVHTCTHTPAALLLLSCNHLVAVTPCICMPCASLLLFCRWSGPYLKQMIESVKATHPNTPLTVYANGSGGLLERLGATGADVVGLDWTTDMADARQRLGNKSVQVSPGDRVLGVWGWFKP